MKALSTASLLFALQLVPLVLAASSSGGIDLPTGSFKPCKYNFASQDSPDCPDGEYCSSGYKCLKKDPAGELCFRDISCLSGFCDLSGGYFDGKCAPACSEESPQCPTGSTCSNSVCLTPNQPIAARCFGNEHCQSGTCLDSKCQPPNAKSVGEDCSDKDSCQLGSMCWKGSCSTRGYKSDGTLGGECLDKKGQYQCFENTAYCDLNAFVTCQPKKSVTQPCGLKLGAVNIPAKDQCFSGRCLAPGFCGPKEVGGVGEPCATDENICLKGNACLDGPGDGVNGPAKTCQAKGYEGKPCMEDGSCKHGLVCYRGGNPPTCETWDTIRTKPCKSDDDCGGGLSQERVWTNYGAFDGIDGGWGTRTIVSGYTCSSEKCKWVYEVSDDTKAIEKDWGTEWRKAWVEQNGDVRGT